MFRRRSIRSRAVVATLALTASVLAPLALGSTPAHAAPATCTGTEDTKWIGTTSSTWATGTNWQGGSAPTSGQTVCIANTATNQPTISTAVSLGDLTGETGTTLTVGASGSLVITGGAVSDPNNVIIVGGGSYTTTAGLTVHGNFQLSDGTVGGGSTGIQGTTTFDTSGTKTITSAFFTAGAVTWTGGNIAAGSNTITNVSSTGSWNLTTHTGTLTAATFVNDGSFTKNGAGTMNIAANVTNSSTGSFTVSGAGTIALGSGKTFGNSGAFTLSGNGNLTATGTFTQAAGTGTTSIASGSTLTDSATASISNGTVSGAGNIASTVTVSGSATFSLKGTVNALTVSGGNVNVGGSGTVGTLHVTGGYNQSAGTVNIDVIGDGGVGGTDYDLIDAGGAATLSGTATFNVHTPSYDPGPYSEVFPLAYASVTGELHSVIDDLSGDGAWSPTYNLNDLTLTATGLGSADPMSQNQGYWLADANGNVYAVGGADPDLGQPSDYDLQAPISFLAPTPTGGGYFAVAEDGGVFAFGDATFQGSMGGQPLNAPVLRMTATPTGHGYWLVATDGGIFSYGDAQFFGSMGGKPLNAAITSIVSSPTGNGYLMVAADGGVFV
jgi:hypothetical protein